MNQSWGISIYGQSSTVSFAPPSWDPVRPRPASSALATFAATAKGSVASSDAWSGSSPSPRGITAPMCAMRRTGPQVRFLLEIGMMGRHIWKVKEWIFWNMLWQCAWQRFCVAESSRNPLEVVFRWFLGTWVLFACRRHWTNDLIYHSPRIYKYISTNRHFRSSYGFIE